MNRRSNYTIGLLLKKCIKDIEGKFTGNNPLSFSHSDFEKLSDDIYEQTKTNISISTLKRIWKEDYEGSPNVSTLDTFAKYLGFKNWREYCNKNKKQSISTVFLSNTNIKRKNTLFLTLGVLLVVFVIAIQYFYSSHNIEPNYHGVEFTILEFDSTQMPVNVIFKYNLKGIDCDSATIRPLGSLEEEFVISASDSIANYTYIRPWQFYPSLTIDGEVVKQLPLNFAYNTWKAGLSNTRKVFYIKYFDDAEIYKNGKLSFTNDFLTRKNFPLDNVEFTTYDLFKRFDNIFGDSLCFETKIRNKINLREEGCGDVNIALCFHKGFILVPFSIEKSPYSPRIATFFNHTFSSKNTDLSFLYQNLEEWNTIKFKTRDKHIDIFINDSIVFSTDYNTKPGKLTGIMFDFKGLGEVDYVKFYNSNNKLIYNDEFD